jgi:hypothetical protein
MYPMDADEAEEDRRWQRIATRWHADESSIRAPQKAVRLALKAAALRRDSAAAAGPLWLRFAAAAMLALGLATWLLPASEPVPGKAAPASDAAPTIHDPWLRAEPCGRYLSCVDAHAELAYLEPPYSRGS